MVDLSNVVRDGLSFCREVEAVKHERFLFDLGAPQRISEQIGFGIRVNCRGHIGFAWSEGQISASELLRQAAQRAPQGPEGDFSGHRILPQEDSYPTTDMNKAIDALTSLVRELRFALPSLLPERSFTINAQLVRDVFCLANRRGTQRDERLVYLLSLRSHQGPPIIATCHTTALPSDPEHLLYQLLWRHCHSLEIALPDSKVLPALFSPQAAGQFWQDFISDTCLDDAANPATLCSLNADLTIYENGTLPGGLGTTHIDGEGVPRQRTALYSKGQPLNIPRDTIASHASKQVPQGMAIRFWGQPPVPGYSNIEIAPGKHSVSELCQKMRYGIWLDYLTPLPTPAPAGIFQRRASIAYLVRDGLPIARLPQFVVQGVYSDMLNRDFMGLGRDVRLNGRIQAPAMLIDGLHLFKRDISSQEDGIDFPQLWW